MTEAAGPVGDGEDGRGTGQMVDEARLLAVRDETRFELGLLHDRVNALLSAEAFLTIAYTAAMSNGTDWGKTFAAVAGPALAVLGLLLAALAFPGVAATARIVLTQTALQVPPRASADREQPDDRRALSSTEPISPRTRDDEPPGLRSLTRFLDQACLHGVGAHGSPMDGRAPTRRVQLHVESNGEVAIAHVGDLVRVAANSQGRYFAPQYARMLAIYDHNPSGEASVILGLQPTDPGQRN